MGSQYGTTVLISGILQGLGAELVFAAFLYKKFNLPDCPAGRCRRGAVLRPERLLPAVGLEHRLRGRRQARLHRLLRHLRCRDRRRAVLGRHPRPGQDRRAELLRLPEGRHGARLQLMPAFRRRRFRCAPRRGLRPRLGLAARRPRRTRRPRARPGHRARVSGCCCWAPPAPANQRCSTPSPGCWATEAGGTTPTRPGSLLIDGVAPRGQRGRAGLMQQDPETQVVLSRLGDDVAFGAENLAVPAGRDLAAGGGGARRRRAAECRPQCGGPLDHPTSALSGGQKQRLALAGILAMRPGLILLDEPTANLDPAGVLEVRDAVGRCLDKTGATLVVVEHRVSVWKDLVDRIVVLQPGSAPDPRHSAPSGVLLDGPPDRVLAEARRHADRAPASGCRATFPRPGPGAGSSAAVRSAGQLLLAAESWPCPVSGPRRRAGFRTIPPVPVQTGITAQVRAGEALTITGPNGAGKSTFALTLAGLLRAGGRARCPPPSELSPQGAGIDPYQVEGRTADRADRHRVPGARAPVRHRPGAGRADVRPAAPGPRRRTRGRAAGAAAADPPGGRQSVHAVRRRKAAAVGGHGPRGPPAGPGAGRAHVRPGRQHVGRARVVPLRTARRRHRRGVRDPRRRIHRRPGRHRTAPRARPRAAAPARRQDAA